MNADGSGGRQLLDRTAVEPEWSPDGKEIAFTLSYDKTYKGANYNWCGIYIMDTNVSDTPRKLATGPGCASSPAWSPDGNKIAYENGQGLDEGGGSDTSDVYVANASSKEGETDQPRALTDYASGIATNPTWSPDGTEIAFTFHNQDGKSSIYKMGADGGGMRPIAPFQRVKNLEEFSAGWPVYDGKQLPVWSPDGEQIAYVRNVPVRDSTSAVGYSSSPSAIYTMSSDGSNPTLVRDFGNGNVVESLDWKPPS